MQEASHNIFRVLFRGSFSWAKKQPRDSFQGTCLKPRTANPNSEMAFLYGFPGNGPVVDPAQSAYVPVLSVHGYSCTRTQKRQYNLHLTPALIGGL